MSNLLENCDMCEREFFNNEEVIQGFCKMCYLWMTEKKKIPMCSNCHTNPVAEKQLCGFTDWCEVCDSTLWSVADNDQNKQEAFTDIHCCDYCKTNYDRETSKNPCSGWYCDECYNTIMKSE